MRKIKYPAIYKHFKENYYVTMVISSPIDVKNVISICKLREEDPIDRIFMSAKHAEIDVDSINSFKPNYTIEKLDKRFSK